MNPEIDPEVLKRVNDSGDVYVFTEQILDSEPNENEVFYPVYDYLFDIKTEPFSQSEVVCFEIFTKNKKDKIYYESKLNQYFNETLFWSIYDKSGKLEIEKTRFYLTKENLQNIRKLINENGLERHHDFILYLIATLQEFYQAKVKFNESEAETKKKLALPQQVDFLKRSMELYESSKKINHKNFDENLNLPEIKSIKFEFKIDGRKKTFKISDSFLLHSTMDGVIQFFNNKKFDNYKEQLDFIPTIYFKYENGTNFKKMIANSLHEWLIGEGLFSLNNGKMTSDAEILFIAKILWHAHITIPNKSDIISNPYDDYSKKNAMRTIRGWINRVPK
jgi:hypothetical protein